MKKIFNLKNIKIFDLVCSLIFFIIYFNSFTYIGDDAYKRAESVFTFIALAPITALFLLSLVFSVLSLVNKGYVYAFSVLSQVFKIFVVFIYFLLMFVFGTKLVFDYMSVLLIFSFVVLIFIIIDSIINKK